MDGMAGLRLARGDDLVFFATVDWLVDGGSLASSRQAARAIVGTANGNAAGGTTGDSSAGACIAFGTGESPNVGWRVASHYPAAGLQPDQSFHDRVGSCFAARIGPRQAIRSADQFAPNHDRNDIVFPSSRMVDVGFDPQ